MIKTYVLDTRTLPDPADGPSGMQACINRLPAERMEKILRIRHTDTRKQSLGAGLLLNKVLDTLAPGADITYGSYGKPFCAGIPFNLSHTSNAVILSILELPDAVRPDSGAYAADIDFLMEEASCSDAEFPIKENADVLIGCDIEQIKPYRQSIARRYFAKAEYQSLEAVQDPEEQAELFCRYWTRKESVMKLTGLGLSLPMELYDVQGSQAVADISKTLAWYEKGLQKGKAAAEYQKAAEILLNQSIYFKEYRYRDCCITVCSLINQFAPFYDHVMMGARN